MIQLVFLCIVSLAAARPYDVPSYGVPAYEPVYEAKPEPYSFAYDTKDEYGTILTRSEVGDELGNKRGSYGFVDAYGIARQVEYVADENGFRAVIKTNEPGTESQSPADAEIISDAVPVKYDAPSVYSTAPAAYARPASAVSPVYARPALAAPVSSLAPVAHLSPLAPAPAVYSNSAPAVYSNSAPAVYSSAPAVYDSAPVYDSAYAPVPEAYGQAPIAYGSSPVTYGSAPVTYGSAPIAYGPSPVYEPLSPQTYGGPSYEQLSDRASQSTDSHSEY